MFTAYQKLNLNPWNWLQIVSENQAQSHPRTIALSLIGNLDESHLSCVAGDIFVGKSIYSERPYPTLRCDSALATNKENYSRILLYEM